MDLLFCLISLVGFAYYCHVHSILQRLGQKVPIFLLALTTSWLYLCNDLDILQQFVRLLIMVLLFKIMTHSWRLDQLEAAGGFILLPSFLSPQELIDLNSELQQVHLHQFIHFSLFQAFASGIYPPNRPSTSFGSFDSIEWPTRDDYFVPSGNTHPMPPIFRKIFERMAALVPEQKFDIISAHQYVVNDYVNNHQDPTQQMGVIVLLAAGDFSGGTFTPFTRFFLRIRCLERQPWRSY